MSGGCKEKRSFRLCLGAGWGRWSRQSKTETVMGGDRVSRGTRVRDDSILQVRLDFDLSAKLVLHSLLLNLRLEEDLERHNETALLLPSQVHVSKFAFAQRTPNLKVVNSERLPD